MRFFHKLATFIIINKSEFLMVFLKTFKSSCKMTHEYMSNISKSIEIKAPVDTVFTYFARPEHVSDQMSDKGVGMTVIPMDIKEGMGVGTTFRIIGDFANFGKLNNHIFVSLLKCPFFKWTISLNCRDLFFTDKLCCFTIPFKSFSSKIAYILKVVPTPMPSFMSIGITVIPTPLSLI